MTRHLIGSKKLTRVSTGNNKVNLSSISDKILLKIPASLVPSEFLTSYRNRLFPDKVTFYFRDLLLRKNAFKRILIFFWYSENMIMKVIIKYHMVEPVFKNYFFEYFSSLILVMR